MNKQKYIIYMVIFLFAFLTIACFCQRSFAAGVASHIYSALRTIEEIQYQSNTNPGDEDLETLKEFFFDNYDPKDEIVQAYISGALIPYILGTIGPLSYPDTLGKGSLMYCGDTGLLYSSILSYAGDSDDPVDIALALGYINHYMVAKNTHPIINEFAGGPYGKAGTHEIVDVNLDTADIIWEDADQTIPVSFFPNHFIVSERHAFFESYLAKDTMVTHNVKRFGIKLSEDLSYYRFGSDYYPKMARIIQDAYVYLWGNEQK